MTDCRLEDLCAVLESPVDRARYPHAERVERGVLVYAASTPAGHPADRAGGRLGDGPGVLVIERAFEPEVVHAASEAFAGIIAEQRAAGTRAGDHFARPGSNDRIWNALEKLAARDPETFVDYYANPALALVSSAWLGPGYQVTSQPNVVNPGATAQVGHRDYHLGFLTGERIEQYPEHVHRLSPALTLQGAVAHSDMPVETGPTCYLPGSQRYSAGYLATARPEFREYFENHHVQLPLSLGDAVFFNPAVIHGAGANRTWRRKRTANLPQVSSAFGRAMETVDRERVCRCIYPALLDRSRRDPAAGYALAAAAEGYPFPTDLDADPPLDGLAPASQADLVHRALTQRWEPARLAAQTARRGGRLAQ